VTGKLTLSDPSRTIDWRQSGHHSLSYFPQPPPFTNAGEYRAWANLPETIAAQRNARSYTLRLQEDGTFRIEDVLAGDYNLQIHLTEGQRWENMIGTLTTNVTVPIITDPAAAPPLDLGTFVVPLTRAPQRDAARR
jgi:hypothetical protein